MRVQEASVFLIPQRHTATAKCTEEWIPKARSRKELSAQLVKCQEHCERAAPGCLLSPK